MPRLQVCNHLRYPHIVFEQVATRHKPTLDDYRKYGQLAAASAARWTIHFLNTTLIKMRIFKIGRGDWDGFIAAFINNLAQLLILTPLCLGVLGFSVELVMGEYYQGLLSHF